jgi:putative restriction endonuclease
LSPNGLPLTKIHHAAFDAHLIGVDPDYRIHVYDRLLEIHDGPFLELGLKGIASTGRDGLGIIPIETAR